MPRDKIALFCDQLASANQLAALKEADTLTPTVICDSLFANLSESAVRITEAIGLISDTYRLLDNEHPQVNLHRAWLIDQVLMILAGDHYVALVAAMGPIEPGVSPWPNIDEL